MEQIYCGTTGYEVAHVEDPTERAWLIEAIEEERFRPPKDAVDERELLDRLTEVSAFERFLHRAYPGQTRFSVEGLGMLIPMLDELIADSAAHGTRSILLGMAHRGRLNVLAHVLGKPYARILAEFEGREPSRRGAPSESTDEGWAGDVKYHAGARRVLSDQTTDQSNGAQRRTVTVVMAPNPSHLEFVDPVVQGMARAADEDRQRAGPPLQDEASSLGVLIHGDASFPGPGSRRRDAQPVATARLSHRWDAPHHRQQPAWLHDRPARGPLDAVRQRPGQRLRDTDRARQRRRSHRVPGGDQTGSGLPLKIRSGFSDRSDRLPALGPQRGR